MSPKISIIIPTYNREGYIKQTMDCMLNQTFSDFELLIIDDCSADLTLQVIEKYTNPRIRVIPLATWVNVPAIRNLGQQYAKGEYLAWMDSDDLCPPDRLEKQAAYLDAHPDVLMVSSDNQLFEGSDKYYHFPSDPETIALTLMFQCCISNSSLMVRKRFIEDTQFTYDETFSLCEDYKFYADALGYGKLGNIPECLLLHRVGHDHITGNSFKSQSQMEERRKLITIIKREAIWNNGFRLTEKELETFMLFYSEAYPTHPSAEDWNALMAIMEKMKKQAVFLHIDLNKLDEVLEKYKEKARSKIKE